MSLIDKISKLFGKENKRAISAAPIAAVEEEFVRAQEKLQPLYTFYTIGPDYITWSYPVDTTPLKEITNLTGCLNSSAYKNDPDFWQNIKNYNNENLKDGNLDLLNKLRSDLIYLATKHKLYGAYTLLGSLENNYQSQFNYFKLAAHNGNKEGMVACGIELLTAGQTEKGREWIEKGAELGEETGLMNMAISYQHGTFTPIDYDKAAYFYYRLIKEHQYYFAFINLGVMYVMANYFHTALELFKKAEQILLKDKDWTEYVNNFAPKEIRNNLFSCEQLLTLPLEDRIKRAVSQYHSPKLEAIFCHNQMSPDSVISENNEQPARWQPKDMSHVDSKDIKEHQQSSSSSLMSVKPEVKYPHDDFVFPIYDVQIRDERIMGNQYELIFLEKNVHLELNQYIQQHIGQLRDAFRKKDYTFVYIPSRLNNIDDVIGSYTEEYEPNQLVRVFLNRDAQSEQIYWSAFFSEEHLPADCAGFLRYKPNRENPDDRFNYEYILFPFQPGTNWEKAFSYLVQFVGTLPFVKSRSKKSLPHDTMLLVDSSYSIYLVDSTGNKLTEEIKMPILSKALYFTLLHHKEGIAIKYLSDYKEELQTWYNALSNRKDTKQSIETLIDPTNNSANEKLSRIRKAFESALENYEDAPDDFIPVGKKTQPYIINIPRTRIFWQPEEMSVF